MSIVLVGDSENEMKKISEQIANSDIKTPEIQICLRDDFLKKKNKCSNSFVIFVLPIQERIAIYDENDKAGSFKREIDYLQEQSKRM